MNKPLNLIIHGASGRNGKRLIAIGSQDRSFKLMGAIVGSQSSSLGSDAGTLAGVGPIGLALTSNWPDPADVAIDFSTPDACMSAIEYCETKSIPLVIATTGLNSLQTERIRQASITIPVCFAPNMSVAVNIAMKLVEQAAKALAPVKDDVDVEILERHHRMKEDSPSGTALKFGQIVAAQMGQTEHVHGRQGMVGKRPRDEIGYHAIRIGDDAGQHTICFGLMGEIIEVRVGASNRDPYATGALLAAKFIVNKPAGLYSMFDVLGL
jgi:4-hydroxy-tetrahydrodipicolinate reductase